VISPEEFSHRGRSRLSTDVIFEGHRWQVDYLEEIQSALSGGYLGLSRSNGVTFVSVRGIPLAKVEWADG
jgi:hypothetical protein